MAAFAGLWELLTGRRVIGLTTSTNAARVLASEGLAESYNIAEFLGKTEGSDELRRPVPVHAGDVLVIDEATQASTADLAMLLEAARGAGARVVLVGDTQQLGAPEAGGMFRLLAGEVPAAELTEVRRFAAPVGSRRIHTAARRGPRRDRRLRPARPDQGRRRTKPPASAPPPRGSPTTCAAKTCCCSPGPTRKPPTSPAGSRPGSSRPATSAAGGYQAQVPLADGNQARPGDLIRARLNTEIDAGGRKLTNRDTLKITAIRGDGVRGTAAAARRHLDRNSSGFPAPTCNPAPSSATPATCTSPRAAPSTPPTCWSPKPSPGNPCTSA